MATLDVAMSKLREDSYFKETLAHGEREHGTRVLSSATALVLYLLGAAITDVSRRDKN